MAESIIIYDTTLRDGTQAENFNISLEDKIKICRELDSFGIDYIEGGWPGANPLSTEFFVRMQDMTLRHAKLAAFGSTRHVSNPPEKDANLLALLAAKTPAVTIFGKSWDIHVTEALRITLEQNLEIIQDSLAFLRQRVEHLFYDAEHFFDGFKANRDYALASIDRAVQGGAELICLCETNGGTLPNELVDIIHQVQRHFAEQGRQVALGIHAHNDAECAVANSIMAVQAGALMVQGTINGYGERCGNANLTSIIPALELKLGLHCNAGSRLHQLYVTTRLINELANLPHNRYQPYVGDSAFAHKGGIHVSAVQRNPLTYEHIDPERVGNERRILISDQSGRANILLKAERFGLQLQPEDPLMVSIVADLKNMETQGYQYEAAEASFELLMRRALGLRRKFFNLEAFSVSDRKYSMNKEPLTEATIRLTVGDTEAHTAAMGDGPVNAMDLALRKALTRFYPSLQNMKLVDYKVRVLNGQNGTGARVRVLIESSDETGRSWGTVGVSCNVIEASWQALVDSINFKLMKDEQQGMLPRSAA